MIVTAVGVKVHIFQHAYLCTYSPAADTQFPCQNESLTEFCGYLQCCDQFVFGLWNRDVCRMEQVLLM